MKTWSKRFRKIELKKTKGLDENVQPFCFLGNKPKIYRSSNSCICLDIHIKDLLPEGFSAFPTKDKGGAFYRFQPILQMFTAGRSFSLPYQR